MKELHHTNVIGLLDVFGRASNISLIFDYMDGDLEMIIKDKTILLPPGHVKSYSIMIFQVSNMYMYCYLISCTSVHDQRFSFIWGGRSSAPSLAHFLPPWKFY